MTFDLALSGTLHLIGAVVTVLGVLTLWAFGGRRPAIAGTVLGLGALVLTAEATVRGLVLGRMPVVGTYENTLVVAIMVAATCMALSMRPTMHIRTKLLRLTAPWALAALAFGAAFGAKPVAIGIEGRGAVAYAHALLGWSTFTVLVVASMSALGMLLDRRTDPGVWQPFLGRSLAGGFVGLTATMATGSLLSFAVFGTWYQWQLVETLAAALWLVYGVALHAFLMFGWRHRKLALFTLSLLPVALMTFWSWSLFSGTYHYFERLL